MFSDLIGQGLDFPHTCLWIVPFEISLWFLRLKFGFGLLQLAHQGFQYAIHISNFGSGFYVLSMMAM
jgi:hypothetical protein